MKISFDVPDNVARQLVPAGQDPGRAALECFALEGYRADRLTESDVRDLLGFDTRMEVHSFLKQHGAFLRYTLEDLEHDREVARSTGRHGYVPHQPPL